jgi:hypothetical protein
MMICNSAVGALKTEKTKGIKVELSAFERNQNSFKLDFSITNQTAIPISILRPTPWQYVDDFSRNQFYPEFFQLEFFPKEICCKYSRMIMQDLLKDVSAFTTINSDETIAISINSREFYKGYVTRMPAN